MTIAIFMETETHIHLRHGEYLDVVIDELINDIGEDDNLEIMRLDVVDQFNQYSTLMEDKVWEAVLELKNNREEDKQLKQQEGE